MSAYGKHFVMMYSQDGNHAMPIVDGRGDVCLYITATDARNAIKDHPFAKAFGFEVFCMGNGEE